MSNLHKRDHRIDLLRGFALASIFINHMPGNRYEKWTHRNFGFSDAAELFVLLAGLAAALAFYRRFAAGERREMTVKALRRAVVLYGAHLATTIAAVGVFAAAAFMLADPEFLELIGLAPLVTQPLPGLIGIATGGYQLGYFNILPLYVVLLVMLPALLWLAAREPLLALAASVALYFATHWLGLQLPSFPTEEGWYFNPLAWQLVFTVGFVIGACHLKGRSIGFDPLLFAAALAYVAFAAVWSHANLGGNIAVWPIPEQMGTLHKSHLPLSRLVHILALAYVLVHLPVWGWLSRLPASFPLTSIGRNSLPVFCAGSLLSMMGWVVILHTGGGVVVETTIVAAGLILMTALAYELDRRSRMMRKVAPAPAAVAEAGEHVVTMPTSRR